MRKILSILAVVLTVGLSSVAVDAEAAKRMGSGKSMGTQRQANVNKAPAAAPAQPSAAATAPAATPGRSWMGPVAGIAAGLGLAALASHLGFGEELASMLLMGLLAAAVMVVVGLVMRKRAAAKNAANGMPAAPAGMRYAYANPQAEEQAHAKPAYKVAMPPVSGLSSSGASGGGSLIGSALASNQAAAPAIPADFDVEAFERNAKTNFVRLQAANDAGNLDDIRTFTTAEMFEALKAELAERQGTQQKTEVTRIDAKVLEVDEDADRYLVSVRFTGAIRSDDEPLEEFFDETWHLTKSRQGQGGWVLAGIQQAI